MSTAIRGGDWFEGGKPPLDTRGAPPVQVDGFIRAHGTECRARNHSIYPSGLRQLVTTYP